MSFEPARYACLPEVKEHSCSTATTVGDVQAAVHRMLAGHFTASFARPSGSVTEPTLPDGETRPVAAATRMHRHSFPDTFLSQNSSTRQTDAHHGGPTVHAPRMPWRFTLSFQEFQMKASALKVSYSVDAPANWAGTYTSNNDSWSENWTWYKDGKANTVNAPHVTIAFSLSHEVAKTSGEWIGFHVSYPLSKSGKNARFNYKIVNGVAVYSNMTRTGFTDDALAEADEVRSDNYSALNDFAAAFFKAATK